MRLVEIVRYIYTRKSSCALIGIFLISWFLCIDSFAQKYTLDIKGGESLAKALQQVSEKFDVKVAFDIGKLSQIIINKEVRGNTTDEIIRNLLQDSGFEFQFKHGRYLIIPKQNTSGNENISECQIQGNITDRETGEILPFANICLNNQNINATASEGGTFSIKNITVNPIQLKISFIGFHPLDTVLPRSNSIMNCNFKLSRKTQIIDSVLVKGVKVDMVDYRNDVDFATTINPYKLNDLPVVVETDIFKTLQLLPGISYTSNSSELSIRGGSSDQNLILFDGQTLYNLSHYYGVVSNINTNVIQDIQVYKGGYDSRYGERVSGIVDIHSKTGNHLRPMVYGDVNLVSGNVTAEIPIGDKLSVVAAFRRSYSDIYKTSLSNKLYSNKPNSFQGDSMVYQTTPSFYFYDYNTKLTYQISDNENISVSIFGSKDFFDNSYNGSLLYKGGSDSLKIATTDKNNWGSYGYSASWQKQWDETFFTNLQVGTSGYSNKYINNTSVEKIQTTTTSDPYLPEVTNNFNPNNQNDLKDFSASLRNTCYVNNNNQLHFGILVRRNSVYYHKDVDKIYVYDNMDESSWVTSIYAQDRILLGNRFTIKPGFRLNYYNSTSKAYIEPRLAANYRFSDKFSVRMATGRYYQYISQVLSQQETGYNKNFWVLANDSAHPVLKSNHFIFGSTYETGKFLFDAEVYYKNYSGLQEYLFASPFVVVHDYPQKNQMKPFNENAINVNTFSSLAGTPTPSQNSARPSYFINGTGESFGLDFFIRYKARIFTSWISYSISKSVHQFPDINNNAAIPAPADQTHQFSWANMITLGKWNLGSTTLFSTGRPYVDNTQSKQELPITRTYKRLPNYFRSDISFNYNFRVGLIHLKAGATIVNIFDTQNYFDVNTRKFDFENTSFAETNLIRSQALSLNLFLHFVL
jgi:ferric enterobactin receptor